MDGKRSRMSRSSDPKMPATTEWTAEPTARRRVVRACLYCRQRKIRCSGQEPRCANCSTRGLTCVYTAITEEENNLAKAKKQMARRKPTYIRQASSPHSQATPHRPAVSSSSSTHAYSLSSDSVYATAPSNMPCYMTSEHTQVLYPRVPLSSQLEPSSSALLGAFYPSSPAFNPATYPYYYDSQPSQQAQYHSYDCNKQESPDDASVFSMATDDGLSLASSSFNSPCGRVALPLPLEETPVWTGYYVDSPVYNMPMHAPFVPSRVPSRDSAHYGQASSY